MQMFLGLQPCLRSRACLQAAVLANVALALQTTQSRSADLGEQLKKMSAVLRFRNVPAHLQHSVIDGIEFYWSQRYGLHDQELASILPPRCVLPLTNV
jgi:hypothetical protein